MLWLFGVFVIWQQIKLVFSQAEYYIDENSALKKKALDSQYVFITFSDATAIACFAHCTARCQCRAFQTCNQTSCQLLTTDSFLNPNALLDKPECTYYDMMTTPISQVICSMLHDVYLIRWCI